jgi:outer membrane protein OmpA-like peptidoglycan-associated protein
MTKLAFGFAALALMGSWTAVARAQNDGAATGSLSASSSEGVSASSTGERAEDNFIELGIFGGILFPSKEHNFEDADTEAGKKQHQEFKGAAPDFGGRIGYYPVRYVGVEFEGAYMPSGTQDGGSANLWALRGHVVGQVPLGGVTPFALIGGGRMGASSDAMGSDSDPLFHFGVGLKVPVTDALGLRLDLRDNMTQKNDASDGTQTNHPEVLLGLSYTIGLGKKEASAPPPPKDTDGDGFLDPQDRCPTVPGVAPDGCPPMDTDKDGFIDPEDKCPNEPGIAPDGCPDKDPDKDGVLNPDDKCPNEPGVPPDGCPDKDPDKDGILDPDDKCPNQPETKNGFEDQDGCPDEVPAAVQKFTGVIQGIEFAFGKATIRPTSKPKLDAAAKVLNDYPTTRIQISGHTDDVGTHERNVELSQERAESVKAYLVSKGVDPGRIETRGAGPDEPIDDNKTAKGRQKNRRIEFKLLH